MKRRTQRATLKPTLIHCTTLTRTHTHMPHYVEIPLYSPSHPKGPPMLKSAHFFGREPVIVPDDWLGRKIKFSFLLSGNCFRKASVIKPTSAHTPCFGMKDEWMALETGGTDTDQVLLWSRSSCVSSGPPISTSRYKFEIKNKTFIFSARKWRTSEGIVSAKTTQ